jgi:two-component system cell cycle response regulator
MQKVFRQSDYLIRWGGEEFVAIARSANKSDAPRLAQRMLEVINKDEFSFSNTQNRTLSCSIGYVCYPMTVLVDKNIHWHSIISLADACLYAAKYSGKNTWVGLEDIVDLELSIKNPSCKKLGDWHKQGKVVLNTSLSSDDLLKWR